jgi:hypothetical protein
MRQLRHTTTKLRIHSLPSFTPIPAPAPAVVVDSIIQVFTTTTTTRSHHYIRHNNSNSSSIEAGVNFYHMSR